MIPELDDELQQRLKRRYGEAVDSWFAALPTVLAELGERWDLDWGTLIQRGSMSVLIRCRAGDGRAAVLKVSPERRRLANEAVALAAWKTAHVPALLAVDERAGALLIEAVEPGTPLVESSTYPGVENVGDLLTSLHDNVVPDPSFRPVAEHIAYLFDSGRKPYERKPELVEVVPPDLYERGRRLALQLAADPIQPVLLHGDLTPVNVLDGGAERGLVAIDPAPCVGDPAFDAVDLVFWRAKDVGAITARAEQLAPAIGAEDDRLLAWCTAFAGMVALELAEVGGEHVDELAALARR
jgi:streptomycin 6-kinase